MLIEILTTIARMAQKQAMQITDDAESLEVKYLYPEWRSGKTYDAGYRVNHNDILYKCLQPHTSQDTWTPDASPSLWAKVLIPDPDIIPEWEQPDSTNAYSKGDRVTYNGGTWESLVDNNVWEPGAVGTESLWRAV